MSKNTYLKAILIALTVVAVLSFSTLTIMTFFTTRGFARSFDYASSYNLLSEEKTNKMIINKLSDETYKKYEIKNKSQDAIVFDNYKLTTYSTSISSDGLDTFNVYGKFALEFSLNKKMEQYDDTNYIFKQKGEDIYLIDLSTSSLNLKRGDNDIVSITTINNWSQLIKDEKIMLLGNGNVPDIYHGEYQLDICFSISKISKDKKVQTINAYNYTFIINEDELTKGILVQNEDNLPACLQVNIINDSETSMIYTKDSKFHVNNETKIAVSIDPDYMEYPYYWLTLTINLDCNPIYTSKDFFVNNYLGVAINQTKYINLSDIKDSYTGHIDISISGKMMNVFPVSKIVSYSFSCTFISNGE